MRIGGAGSHPLVGVVTSCSHQENHGGAYCLATPIKQVPAALQQIRIVGHQLLMRERDGDEEVLLVVVSW